MNIIVLDTETLSIDHKLCYNIGYEIVSADENGFYTLESRDFVVREVYSNIPLFNLAYYAKNRPFFAQSLRNKTCKQKVYRNIMKAIANDVAEYEIEAVYAYNCNFDKEVIEYNCEYFHTENPLANIPFLDIRGYAHEFICGEEYKSFCESNQYFTEKGHYATSAETVYRYLFDNDFVEAHTALADAKIETQILDATICHGAVLGTNYTAKKGLWRNVRKPMKVVVDGETIFNGEIVKSIKSADCIRLYTK